MIINDTIYTCGDIGDAHSVIRLMKDGKCPLIYFVYKTNNPRFLYQIATYRMLTREKAVPVILGIASSKRNAFKIVCHMVSNVMEE